MLHVCPACNASVQSPAKRFCPRCGQPLSTASPPTASLSKPRLDVTWPGGRAALWLDRPALTLGRTPDNDLQIDYPIVSRHHARLERVGHGYKIVNLSQTNGLLLGVKLVQEVQFSDGMELRIGDGQGASVSLIYRDGSGAPIGPLPPVNIALNGQGSVLIGREGASGLRLDHPTVSRQHARVEADSQGHALVDLGSLNGTFVNGQRIKRQRLKPGDVAQIGAYVLHYTGTALVSTAEEGVHLEARRLVKRVKTAQGNKTLLDTLSLIVQPNEFVALVGGSGAGKSTLLRALNGFSRAEGEVLINGDNLYANFDAYRPIIGYVPQTDIIHRTLPVGRALDYVAQLRLPSDLSASERETRIDDVLAKVDMHRCKDTVVQDLSGGQLKRVSTAVELLAGPRLFFLDEPTSGLDPGLDKRLMYTFRQIADSGRTVILVTHATANIRQCDHVAFLAPGGRLVFFGPPDAALRYFNKTDFADIYTEVEQDPAGHAQRFAQSPQYQQYVAHRQQRNPRPAAHTPRPASPGPSNTLRLSQQLRQFSILTRRYLELIIRDRRNLAFLLLQAPIIAALLFMVAKSNVFQISADRVKDAIQVIFVMATAAVWFGVINAVREITKEGAIYFRERLANLGILPYVFSKVTALAGLCLLQSAALLSLTTLKTGWPQERLIFGAGLDLFVTVYLTALGGMATGLLVSALVSNEDRAMSIVPLILIPQIILAGVIFKLEGVGEWLSKVTLAHWAVHAMGSIVDICKPYGDRCDDFVSLGYTHAARAVLTDWLALISFTVLFLALTCVALKRKDAV